MKYEYTGRHIEVTPAIKAHIENQFNRLDHLFENVNAKAHIIIEVTKGGHRSEIIVKFRDHVFTAESKVSDMYQSISKTIEKIEKQVLKLKNKVIDKKQKVTKIALVGEKEVESEDIATNPKIVRVTGYSIKPMTDEEAVIRLNEDDNRFVVFRESKSQKISVIYRRKDGNYGLIQP